MIGAIVAAIVLLIAIAAPVGVHVKNNKHTCNLHEKDTHLIRNARLELFLEGYDEHESSTTNLNIIESSVLNSYNNVSGGCDDIYERYMYDARVIEMATEHNFMDPYYDSVTATAIVETKISCYDCPKNEIFASDYPEVDYRTNRYRKNRVLSQMKTRLNAGDFLYVLEEKLVEQNVATGISLAQVENAKSGVYKKFGKKSKKSKNSCYEGKGKGKGSKTAAPSVSFVPSSSMQPSGSPSVSMEPSRGKGGKGLSKTSAPSISEQPSQSFAPSCSLQPSIEPTTASPSLTPSTMPSSSPSLSL